ncbi:gluconokinase [Lagierella sp.]|uniref:gluconokinase n=1 Tax=Lagierella sp. TaxID=2849657 RepID=UPI0026280DF0|nr:gluconokinase [Lagierella sp.]
MKNICIDIGTTTIKGIIYDEWGRVVDEAFRNSKLLNPQPGFMEQDSEEIRWNVRSIIRELVSKIYMEREEIGFISFSAYMHSLVGIDENNQAITPVMLWNDRRSQDFVQEAKANGKGLELYKSTGTPVHPMSPLYKIIYLRERQRDIFDRCRLFVGMKEIILHWMTGEWIVDQSIASATGLFNIHDRVWDAKALEYAGIGEGNLPRVVSTTHIMRNMTDEFKEDIGIREDIPIIIGASDGCLANLGSHGLNPGTAVSTIGTSGALRVVTDHPLIDEKGAIFSYILTDNLFVSGGAINNGGIFYEWLRKGLSLEKHIDEVFDEDDPEKYGKGLIFLPFISGERAPYWDADLRGSLLGLTHSHGYKDMLIAGIRGVNFSLRDVFEVLLNSTSTHVNEFYVNGGFTQSDLWVQSFCNIVQRPVFVTEQGDGPLFGAFLLGILATGKIEDLSQAQEYFIAGKEFLPIEEFNHNEEFNIYRRAIEQNRSLLHELARLSSSVDDK